MASYYVLDRGGVPYFGPYKTAEEARQKIRKLGEKMLIECRTWRLYNGTSYERMPRD